MSVQELAELRGERLWSAEALVLSTDGCGLFGTGSSGSLLIFRNDLCTLQ